VQIDKFPGLNEMDNRRVPIGDKDLLFDINPMGNITPGIKTDDDPHNIEQGLTPAMPPLIENHDISKWFFFELPSGKKIYIAQYWNDTAGKYYFAITYDLNIYSIMMDSTLAYVAFDEVASACILNDKIYLTSKQNGIWRYDPSAGASQIDATGAKCIIAYQGFLVLGNYTSNPNLVKYSTTATPETVSNSLIASTTGGNITGLGSFFDKANQTVYPSLMVAGTNYINVVLQFPGSNMVNKKIWDQGVIGETIQPKDQYLYFIATDNQLYSINYNGQLKKISYQIENFLEGKKLSNSTLTMKEDYQEWDKLKEGLPGDWEFYEKDGLIPRLLLHKHTLIFNGNNIGDEELIGMSGLVDKSNLSYPNDYAPIANILITESREAFATNYTVNIYLLNKDGFTKYSIVSPYPYHDKHLYPTDSNRSHKLVFTTPTSFRIYTSGRDKVALASYSNIYEFNRLSDGTWPFTEIASTTTFNTYYMPIGETGYYYLLDHTAQTCKIYDSSDALINTINEDMMVYDIFSYSGKDWYLIARNGTKNDYPFLSATNDVLRNTNEKETALEMVFFSGASIAGSKTLSEKHNKIMDARALGNRIYYLVACNVASRTHNYEYQLHECADVLNPIATSSKIVGIPAEERLDPQCSLCSIYFVNDYYLIIRDPSFERFYIIDRVTHDWRVRYKDKFPLLLAQDKDLESYLEYHPRGGMTAYLRKASETLQTIETDTIYFPNLTCMKEIKSQRKTYWYDYSTPPSYAYYSYFYYRCATTEAGLASASYTKIDWKIIYENTVKNPEAGYKYWQFKIETKKTYQYPDIFKGISFKYETGNSGGEKVITFKYKNKYGIAFSDGFTILENGGIFTPAQFPSSGISVVNNKVFYDHYCEDIIRSSEIKYKINFSFSNWWQWQKLYIDALEKDGSAVGEITLNGKAQYPVEKQKTSLPFSIQGRDLHINITANNYKNIKLVDLQGRINRGRK